MCFPNQKPGAIVHSMTNTHNEAKKNNKKKSGVVWGNNRVHIKKYQLLEAGGGVHLLTPLHNVQLRTREFEA
jgi:hypothetical protein